MARYEISQRNLQKFVEVLRGSTSCTDTFVVSVEDDEIRIDNSDAGPTRLGIGIRLPKLD